MKLDILDIHSGDLTTSCMRQVALRRQGKYTPQMAGAMYKGNLFGWACTYLHRNGLWDEDAIVDACAWATAKVQSDLREEGRDLTDAVKKPDNLAAIHREVAECILEYARRFGERFQACRFIGSELPIHWELHLDDGRTATFSSHLDLMFRDVDGVWGRGRDKLIVWDWKFWSEAPSAEYLARNKQMLLYFLVVRMGSVQLPDGEWIHFNQWPQVAWCHAPHLKPFGRKTIRKDDNGVVVQYLKGDTRPDASVVRWIDLRATRSDDMIEELSERTAMLLDGYYPMTPDPIGCSLCESQMWCPRFDTASIGQETAV